MRQSAKQISLLTHSVSFHTDLTSAAAVNTFLPLQKLPALGDCPVQKTTPLHKNCKSNQTDSLLQWTLMTRLLKSARNCLILKAIFPTREAPSRAP